jgi:hypothetical protein
VKMGRRVLNEVEEDFRGTLHFGHTFTLMGKDSLSYGPEEDVSIERGLLEG